MLKKQYVSCLARLRIKPSLNQLMKKLAELPFGGIKHPLAFF